MGIQAYIAQVIVSFNNRVDNSKPYLGLHMVLQMVKETFHKNERKNNSVLGAEANILGKNLIKSYFLTNSSK